MEKLFKAAREGDIDELKRAIESVGDDEIKDFVNIQKSVTNNSPLHIAAKGGFLDICETLYQYGAELDVTNTDERTPLHFAAMKGYKDICNFFIENGAILDSRDILLYIIYRILIYF